MGFNPSVQLAVNYSPEIEALHRAGLINLDLYKLPDWPDLIASVDHQFPVYVHFTLLAGTGGVDQVDWKAVDRIRTQTRTQYINLHFGSPPDLDPTDPVRVDQVIQQAMDDILLTAEHVGIENVILENTPIQPGQGYMLPVIDPIVISRVIDATGCGLLLDLAHARLAAGALGIDEHDYLANLPVDHLRELHITGIGLHRGIWVDHMAMQLEDWQLLDWSLDQINRGQWARPAIAAFEYGGLGEIFRWRSQRSVLETQVPQIWRRLRTLDR